ncbi:NRDE family protein [Psychrobacillus antarcticus]|uniref:NRDE family protein n=1 Tax=Psychrobacillus antarcticus TaxID=2879115 RepID=UPI00240793C6|nr:NRDE family protein [Psychrobacillus antarcticus]
MCLVNFHLQSHPVYPLVVVANRDEFYERPTAVASFWEDYPSILAGRDLLQMGTWLGVTREGRFAALTNYRDPMEKTGRFSRGDIVRDYLANDDAPLDFIQKLRNNRSDYGGYNVVVGDAGQLFHYNNILDEMNEISPGTHSLSNHTLNTPWPKVAKGKKLLGDIVLSNPGELQLDSLFDIISDRTIAEDENLPQTGVGLEMERLLSPLFIKSPTYGTRSSTVLLIDKDHHVTFVERTFQDGKLHKENRFDFTI